MAPKMSDTCETMPLRISMAPAISSVPMSSSPMAAMTAPQKPPASKPCFALLMMPPSSPSRLTKPAMRLSFAAAAAAAASSAARRMESARAFAWSSTDLL
ncbi:hypothetical protein COSO111634_34105 [Corallococcus soli]